MTATSGAFAALVLSGSGDRLPTREAVGAMLLRGASIAEMASTRDSTTAVAQQHLEHTTGSVS